MVLTFMSHTGATGTSRKYRNEKELGFACPGLMALNGRALPMEHDRWNYVLCALPGQLPGKQGIRLAEGGA